MMDKKIKDSSNKVRAYLLLLVPEAIPNPQPPPVGRLPRLSSSQRNFKSQSERHPIKVIKVIRLIIMNTIEMEEYYKLIRDRCLLAVFSLRSICLAGGYTDRF